MFSSGLDRCDGWLVACHSPVVPPHDCVAHCVLCSRGVLGD